MASKSPKDDKKNQLSTVSNLSKEGETTQSMAPPPFQLKAAPVQMRSEGGEGGTETATPATEPATEPETNTVNASDVTLTYGSNANQSIVPDSAETIIKEILATAGETSATISSTARTAEDQARVMYNNLESEGVDAQKELYGSNGDAVIDVYSASKEAGKTADEIKADMLAKINELGPSNVSKHCADFETPTVVDIAPSSITNKTEFIAAAQADSRVSKFLQPPSDPGYHLEMPR